jgi:hypothetical protein
MRLNFAQSFHLFCSTFLILTITCYKIIIGRTKFLLDINECAEGNDDCDRRTQLCLNTPGSFKCQDKVVDTCLPGLKYNLETKLCEGALPAHALFYVHSINCEKLLKTKTNFI